MRKTVEPPPTSQFSRLELFVLLLRFISTGGVFDPRCVMGNLLHYAVVFLVVAIIAAFFGFVGVAGTAVEGARLLFWIAIILFVVSLVAGYVRRP